MKKISKELKKTIIGWSIGGAVFCVALGISYWAMVQFWLNDIKNIPYISYRYELASTNRSVTIISVSPDCPSSFEIPPRIEGYPVTKVDDYAFKNNTNITSVSIPSSVTTLGNQVFYGCSNLDNIHATDNLTHIGTDAFVGTKFIESGETDEFLVLGSVIVSYKGTFPANTAIVSTDEIKNNVTSNHPDWNIVDIGGEYSGVTNSLFAGQQGIVFAEIPSYLSLVPDNLFENCRSLKEVIFHEQNIDVGNYVFNNCEVLEDVIFPSKISSLGSYSFQNTGINGEFVFPITLSALGEGTFKDCEGITSISIPTNAVISQIGDKSFSGCTNLASVTLSQSVDYIGLEAFMNTNIETFDIPKSVTTLKQSVFENCYRLRKVTAFHEGITEIQSYAFKNCYSLETFMLLNDDGSIFPGSVEGKILIPETVSILGGTYASSNGGVFAFDVPGVSSSLFSNIYIPRGVTILGESTFLNNAHLRNVEFGFDYDEEGHKVYGIEQIGASAFEGCSSIDSFISPSSLNIISNSAFKNCTSLETVVLPMENVLFGSIEVSLFENCSSLVNVSIPSSVATIKEKSFKGLSSLETIVIPSLVSSVRSEAFSECPMLTIFVEKTEEECSSWATDWKDSSIPTYYQGEWHYDANNHPVIG